MAGRGGLRRPHPRCKHLSCRANIILACRALGLGTVITTNHIRCEEEVKAVLGIPEDVATFALMPIGWPLDRFGPLTRRPLAEIAHADRWGAAWPG